jgi:hypothetical protein
MIKPPPPKSRGIAGMMMLFCVAGGAAGLAFDLFADMGPRFSAATLPGARAALGVAVALALTLGAHALRLVLGRKDETGGPRARDHA